MDIQHLADFCGDSFELARKARTSHKQLIVFCGVKFMAESAKVMNPEKRVFLPRVDAGCPMADTADGEAVRQLRLQHPDAVAVCYVNSTAEVKAQVDICCTSGNVDKIIASIPEDKEIIFLPDANLGANMAKKTGRKFILWEGCCPIHDALTCNDILAARKLHPGWPVLVHPECRPEVVDICDEALSTAGILKRVKEIDAPGFIIATECGILPRLVRENPGKGFAAASGCMLCRDMKLFTPEMLIRCIETGEYAVELPQELAERARLPIERMLAVK
jgi:quinolinate synthase